MISLKMEVNVLDAEWMLRLALVCLGTMLLMRCALSLVQRHARVRVRQRTRRIVMARRGKGTYAAHDALRDSPSLRLDLSRPRRPSIGA